MTFVVSLCGQKGGAGKSTLAVNLAAEACQHDQRVVLVDVDPQQTAARWGDLRVFAVPVVVSAQAARLPQEIEKLAPNADLIIIDSAGKADRELLAVARVSDLVLLPCRATTPDIDALDGAHDILKLATAQQSKLIYVVINALLAKDAGRRGRHSEAVDAIKTKGIAVAPVWTTHRVAYQDSMPAGLSAPEYNPADTPMVQEIGGMYRWMMEVLHGTA